MNIITITEDDDDIRIDRWFKRHTPNVPYGLVQKLIRKGAVKLDDKKIKTDHKIKAGQKLQYPDIEVATSNKQYNVQSSATAKQAQEIFINNIIYKDKNIIAINKPAGIPVQGGSKVRLSIDDTLVHLPDILNQTNTQDIIKYKLVHRLDKDTSGVLLIARNNKTASKATEAFRHRTFKKTYWALIVGVPSQIEGTIDLPLDVVSSAGNTEKTEIDYNGKKAITHYKVIESISKKLSFVEITPETGRKHQIRAHFASIEHPIIGDGKYGGAQAFIDGLSKNIHLHARRIQHDNLMDKTIDISATLPKHMQTAWKLFEFDSDYKNL